jgi:hypothetical protein
MANDPPRRAPCGRHIAALTQVPPGLAYYAAGVSCLVIALAVVQEDGHELIEPVFLDNGCARVGHTSHGDAELLPDRDAAKRICDHLGERLAAAHRRTPT